jgi:hypothetical protein
MCQTSGVERKVGSEVKTAITCEVNTLDFRFDPIPTEGRRRRNAKVRSRTDYRSGLVATRIGGSAEIDFKWLHRKQANTTFNIGPRVAVASPDL